jgi:hypothetical protein
MRLEDDVKANTMHGQSPFQQLLASSERSAEIPESADLYGWLAGSWHLDVLRYGGVDLNERGVTAEAHFAWVLEGRAIQDVWIMPRTADRTPRNDMSMNMYGSTLRSWDPGIQAWRIAWTNPAGNHREQQIGQRHGRDIVQLGVRPDGTTTRWMFREITADSFHWTGEALAPDGHTWVMEGEFRARRIAGGGH